MSLTLNFDNNIFDNNNNTYENMKTNEYIPCFFHNNLVYTFDKMFLQNKLENYIKLSMNLTNFFYFFLISEEKSILSDDKTNEIIQIYIKKFNNNTDYKKFREKKISENINIDDNTIVISYRDNLFEKFSYTLKILILKIRFLQDYFNHYIYFLNEKDIFDLEKNFADIFNNIYYIKLLSKNIIFKDIFNFDFI